MMQSLALSDPPSAILSAAAIGQAVLCMALLWTVSGRSWVHLALGAVFLTLAVLVAGPAATALAPELYAHHLGLCLTALYLLPPTLWLYVKGLTAPDEWRPTPQDYWHGVAPMAAAVGSVMIWTLPEPVRHAFFVEGELAGGVWAAVVALTVFALVVTWNVLSAVYLLAVLRRLVRYRRQLKNLFSNNDRRELNWLTWFAAILASGWLITAATLFADNLTGNLPLDRTAGSLLGLAVIFVLGLYGLRQKPGFEGRHEDAAPAEPTAGKYLKSALAEDQAGRIAERIRTAMESDNLYLDPNLSLPKLARHIAVPVNLVSQTLNQTIGESFFDHVNRWRVEAAAPRIAAGEANVLTIALDVGFNTRSTFYKAFRKVTGRTPRDYRLSAPTDSRSSTARLQ